MKAANGERRVVASGTPASLPVLALNAVPIFADIDPHTHNISPAAIRAAITERH